MTCGRCRRGWQRLGRPRGHKRGGAGAAAPAGAGGAKRSGATTGGLGALVALHLSPLLHSSPTPRSKRHQVGGSVGSHRTTTQHLGHYSPVCRVSHPGYEPLLLLTECQRSTGHELSHGQNPAGSSLWCWPWPLLGRGPCSAGPALEEREGPPSSQHGTGRGTLHHPPGNLTLSSRKTLGKAGIS